MALSLKNTIAAPILLAAALFVGGVIGQVGVELEVWGGVFLLVALALLIGIGVAHGLAARNHNVSAVIVSAVCAALLALGSVMVAPEIGWGKSLWLMLLLVGWLVASLILALRKK